MKSQRSTSTDRSATSLIYERPSGASRATRVVEPTPDAIREAEAAGWVAPDPDTFARRCAILTPAPWEGLRVAVALKGTVVAVEEPNLRVRLDGGLGEVLVVPSICTGLTKAEGR